MISIYITDETTKRCSECNIKTIAKEWVDENEKNLLRAKRAEMEVKKIRQSMIAELCAYCMTEVTLEWDVKRDGYKAYCPCCGKRLMICSQCERENCNNCECGDCMEEIEND